MTFGRIWTDTVELTADAIGQYAKMCYWLAILWAFPAALAISFIQRDWLIAVIGLILAGFGFISGWLATGIVKHRRGRTIASGLSGLLMGVSSGWSALTVTQSTAQSLQQLLMALVLAAVGTILVAGAFRSHAEEPT